MKPQKRPRPTPLLLFCAVCLCMTCPLLLGPAVGAEELDHYPLDALRAKGTHNSYHKRPFIPLHPRHWYEHPSLFTQLEHLDVRALELDVHNGDEGFAVYHIRFIDSRSHCATLTRCLEEIRRWSDLEPDHHPLMVWIEIKDYAGGGPIESARPIDAEIRSVVGDRLLTPDVVRSGHSSLREALRSRGWPTVAESRGRILFMLTASPEQIDEYTSGGRHLRGRVMFPEAAPGQFDAPWAAATKLVPDQAEYIQHAKAEHLLISSTTCTAERRDDICRMNRHLALEAGVNILLDDFVGPAQGNDYHLELSGKVITAPVPVAVGGDALGGGS